MDSSMYSQLAGGREQYRQQQRRCVVTGSSEAADWERRALTNSPV
jgi:hypothetical protein